MATATKKEQPAIIEAPVTTVSSVTNLPEPSAPEPATVVEAPKLKEFPDGPTGIDVVDRKQNPEARSVQEAALKAYQRAQEPGQWINLPNGEAIKVQDALKPAYEDTDHLIPKMISNPEWMLKDPLPNHPGGPRYAWRKRDDPMTRNYHGAQRIRYVETCEVNPQSPYALYDEYQQPNNTYVGRDTLILCEIRDPALAYALYKKYEDKAIMNVAGLPRDIGHLKGEDQTTYRGSKMELEIKDTARGA